MDRIGVVGASYRTTDVSKLAAASLPAELPQESLVELARLAGFSELVYLGTCNRVEFYFRAETRLHTSPLLFHLRHSLADLTDGACQLPEDEALYVFFGREAVRHLFRVTSALDSMMVGEAQITGQTKEAHEHAHQLGLLSSILDQTFHEAFHLAKRIRTETELTRRPVSLVTLVERKLQEHLKGTTSPVLIVGAGEMARQSLRLLRGGDPERPVVIANRTLSRAEEIAASDPATRAMSLAELGNAPPEACLVVSAVSSSAPVLSRNLIHGIRARLPTGEPLLVVDLGMPPNVDPSAVAIPGLELHGIEDMRCEAETNRRLRMAEMGRCEELLEHQLVILRRRLLDRALSPVAQGLRHSFEEIADRALHHAFSKDLSQLDEAERKAVRRCAEAMTKRLVQVPLRGLKGAAWHHSSAVIDNFIRGMESDDGKSPEE